MNKLHNRHGFTVLEGLVVCLALIVAGLAGYATVSHLHHASQPPAAPAACSLKNVPAQFCERAKKAGYYCPSWAAKPGEMAPDFCYKIQSTAQPNPTTTPQQCGCREFNNCAPQSACEGQSSSGKP